MKDITESIAESMLKSVANTESSSALIDFGDSVLDSATETIISNDILKDIPVVGALVGLTKGVMVYRDRRYVSKILSYLSETSKASETDRERYKKKLDTNPEECLKAGETIMDIIDKVTSAEKAVMLGKIFRAYMHEDDLSTQQLIYLSEIIERAYLQDLVALQNNEVFNSENLESVGIKRAIRNEDVNGLLEKAFNDYEEQQDRNFLAQSKGITHANIRLPMMPESQMTDAGLQLAHILREY
jgi:uncharacterized protein YaiI (UPF0178 family)